jgi:hypothetical protein
MRNLLTLVALATAMPSIVMANGSDATANVASPTSVQSADLLTQLLSPPAPLRLVPDGNTLLRNNSEINNSEIEAVASPQWFSFSAGAINSAQSPGAALSPQQLTLLQSIGGFAQGLLPAVTAHPEHLPLRMDAASAHPYTPSLGGWLANAAQYAGNVQVSATMPMSSVFATQAPTDTINAAIQSREVTQYLEQHSEVVSAAAKLLGWQNTGLLPSVADIQKMASNHVSAVSSNVEQWALQNVSFSSSSQAIASSDTQEPMLEWQWSVNSNSQSQAYGDSEAGLSANLRRLFGMNEYY